MIITHRLCYVAVDRRPSQDRRYWTGKGWSFRPYEAALYSTKSELREDMPKRSAVPYRVMVIPDAYPTMPDWY